MHHHPFYHRGFHLTKCTIRIHRYSSRPTLHLSGTFPGPLSFHSKNSKQHPHWLAGDSFATRRFSARCNQSSRVNRQQIHFQFLHISTSNTALANGGTIPKTMNGCALYHPTLQTSIFHELLHSLSTTLLQLPLIRLKSDVDCFFRCNNQLTHRSAS